MRKLWRLSQNRCHWHNSEEEDLEQCSFSSVIRIHAPKQVILPGREEMEKKGHFVGKLKHEWGQKKDIWEAIAFFSPYSSPGPPLLLQNPLNIYPTVISEVKWKMIHVKVVLSSKIWYQQHNLSQPCQQDPPPCSLPTSTSPKYKAWEHKFHLSFAFTSLWHFCFTQYFPGGLFSFSSWNYCGKTGKRSEVWIFWWGHWALDNSPLENSLKKGLQEKNHKCAYLGIISARRLLGILIPLAFCFLWFMDPKAMVLLMDQQCPCWISTLALH